MNERLKNFLDDKKDAEKRKYESEKQRALLELGLYEKVYAPIIGYGHIKGDNKVVKFPITSKSAQIGNIVKASINGEKVDVILDKIESNYSWEFPSSEWDSANSTNKYYKKVPIEITDEEYQEVKKYSKKEETTENNPIATVLTVIAWIVFIGGFIAGIALGIVEVEKGYYYTYTDTEFSFAVAFIYWCVSLISGTMFLGFAEIIKLLDAIKKK